MNRREFVLGAGGAGIAVALAACGGVSGQSGPADTASLYRGDFRTIALAAALENQAVSVYKSLLAAVHAGTLDASAAAFTSVVHACLNQHTQHAEAWNAMLRTAGKPAITGVPLSGHPAVMRTLSSASTLTKAAALAIQLENQAAQTYVVTAGSLTSPAGVATAASIAPVEAMHAAILAFMAGDYPSSAAFGASTPAVRTSELTI
jgi:rubrerythrin